jgi:hypothetical protein
MDRSNTILLEDRRQLLLAGRRTAPVLASMTNVVEEYNNLLSLPSSVYTTQM